MDVALSWLGAALINGTVFTALVWLVSTTWLRGASARVLSGLWLLSLAQFLWWRPFTWHVLPLTAARVSTAGSAATSLPALVYAAVVGCLLTRFAFRHWRLRCKLLQLPAAGPELLAGVREGAEALRLRTLPDVRVSSERVAPFSVGPLRPILVLPEFLCEPGPRLHAVLLHELAHVVRRDHAALWLERTVRSLFFFWPPVYFASHKLGEARELACDERAIERGGLCPVEYAQLLVDVVASTRAPRSLDTQALAIGRSAWRLERRLERLLAQPWSAPLRTLQHATVLLLLAAALVGLRIDMLRAVSEQAFPACDGSAMSHPPPSAAAEVLLECGP